MHSGRIIAAQNKGTREDNLRLTDGYRAAMSQQTIPTHDLATFHPTDPRVDYLNAEIRELARHDVRLDEHLRPHDDRSVALRETFKTQYDAAIHDHHVRPISELLDSKLAYANLTTAERTVHALLTGNMTVTEPGDALDKTLAGGNYPLLSNRILGNAFTWKIVSTSMSTRHLVPPDIQGIPRGEGTIQWVKDGRLQILYVTGTRAGQQVAISRDEFLRKVGFKRFTKGFYVWSKRWSRDIRAMKMADWKDNHEVKAVTIGKDVGFTYAMFGIPPHDKSNPKARDIIRAPLEQYQRFRGWLNDGDFQAKLDQQERDRWGHLWINQDRWNAMFPKGQITAAGQQYLDDLTQAARDDKLYSAITPIPE